ncbi:MAG: hypothetical protein ABSE49_31360 [Polyangiaceae bacterium]|jgi:hypothetical protein
MFCARVLPRSLFLTFLVPLLGSTACSSGNTPSPAASDDGGPATSSGDDSGSPSLGHQATLLASFSSSMYSVYSFQIDATNAYALVDNDEGNDSTTVMKVPLSGGAPVTLANDPQYATALAVSPSTLYWVDPSGPQDEVDASSNTTGLVMSVPLGGGNAVPVATDQAFPSNVAVDSSGVYWVNQTVCNSFPCQATVGTVMMLPTGSTTPVTLASVPAQPAALALDATNVYWGTNDGRVMMVPKSATGGGTPTTLAYYETNVGSLVVAGSDLYWTTGTGDIMRTPIAGGATTAILVGSSEVGSLVTDGTSLYWITYDQQFSPTGTTEMTAIDRMALTDTDTTPVTLWTGSDSPDTLQVDATSVYFTTSSGALWKLSPK